MLGRLQPLTVERQEMTELIAEREKLEEKDTLTVWELRFCNAVDIAEEVLREISSLLRISRDDLEYASYHLGICERKLYECQNNP